MKKPLLHLRHLLLLSRQIEGYGLILIRVLGVHFLYKLMPLVLGFGTARLISELLFGRIDRIGGVFVVILSVIIFQAFLSYLDILVSHDMAYKILTNLRSAAYRHLDKVAPAALGKLRSGDMLSIILEDVERLEWFYAHTISQVFVALILPMAGIFLLGSFDLALALLLCFFIALMLLTQIVGQKRSNQQGAAMRSSLGRMSAGLVDAIQGMQDILSFQWQKPFFLKHFKEADAYNQASAAYAQRAAEERAFHYLLMGLSSLVMSLRIIFLVLEGRLEARMALPLILLSSLVYAPLQDALAMATNYGNILAAAERLFDLFALKPVVKDTGTLGSKAVLDQEGERSLSFEQLGFAYPHTEGKRLFDKLSFTVKQGEKLALVGSSGVGKTSLTRLLLREWPIQEGSIRIHGIDIQELSFSALRSLVTLVPQDLYLFHRSIRENLLMAKPEATEEAMRKALKEANALEFVDKLPEGLDTMMGERGVLLSGGEKQRIALAQAILKDAPILVLDEASSNLDAKNEAAIHDALDRIMEGRLCLVIAHRISTMKEADRLIFLADGRVQAEGCFDELYERSADFRKLIGSLDS